MLGVLGLTCLSTVALAHGGGLAAARSDPISVPTWLFLSIGGAVVGAPVLLSHFVTDREFLASLHGARRDLPDPSSALRLAARLLGLASLAAVVGVGVAGPVDPLRNAAILLVWVGWWGGYTMSVYLVGNSWPAVGPFETLSTPVSVLLNGGLVDYPRWLAGWPAVLAVLGLVWAEVVTPLAENPGLLARATGGYLVCSVVGVALVGADAWFSRVDPLSALFRHYGAVAPVRREGPTLTVSVPGSGLVATPAIDRSDVAFVVALVWGTTFDGLVSTPLWADLAPLVVSAGIPPAVLHPGVLLVGFLTFLACYWLACRAVRSVSPTTPTTAAVARLFAPALLPIAAGYHLAQYLGYVITLAPALTGALAAPLDPGTPVTAVLPDWFGVLPIAFVLLGHLLAVGVAHAAAVNRFPSVRHPIRGHYPIAAVVVLYTMASLWVVTRPYTAPPYL